ncbi:MAG TPA: DUF5615 family PIN-like protein [Polyangiaceae bacterium]
MAHAGNGCPSSVKILLDMNLSPTWVPSLRQAGFDSVHWRDIGDVRAPHRRCPARVARAAAPAPPARAPRARGTPH